MAQATDTKTEPKEAKEDKRRRSMSDDHKAALAAGREQRAAVNEYLQRVEGVRPKRGRKRSMDTVRARLDAILKELEDAAPVDRIVLRAEQARLEGELVADESTVDMTDLETKFIENAKDFSRRKGITYALWREQGVPADVLKKAGISKEKRAAAPKEKAETSK